MNTNTNTNKVDVFVCADTRQLYGKDFDEESSLASYQRLVRSTVLRIQTLSTMHPTWVSAPAAIYVPNNQNNAQLVTIDKLLNSDGIVCPLLNTTIIKQFWKDFIMDCLQKISVYMSSKTNTTNKSSKIYVIIISSNLGLLGNYDMDNDKYVKEIVQRFSSLALEISSKYDMTIHFICPIVSVPPGLSMCNVIDDVGCTQLQMELSTQMQDKCIFQPIINTSIYYEEEIRLILSNISPCVSSRLAFPSLDGQHCSLLIDLIPSSVASADMIHEGMSTPLLHSVCSKKHFNPLYIEGHAFTIIPTMKPSVSEKDKASNNQNKVIFKNLAKLLAKDGTILVLKVPFLENKCSQYWAIIPPSCASSMIPKDDGDNTVTSDISYQQMILIKLIDKDSLLRCNDKEISDDIVDGMESNDDDDDDDIIEYLQHSLQGMAFHEYNPRSSFSGYVNYMMTNTNISKPPAIADSNVNINTSASNTNIHSNTQSKIPSRKPSSAPPGQLTLAKSSSSSSASSSASLRQKGVPQPQVHRAVDLQKQNPNAGRGRDPNAGRGRDSQNRTAIRGGGRGRGRVATTTIAQVINSVNYDDDDEVMDF